MAESVGFDSQRTMRFGRSRLWRATGTSFTPAPLQIPSAFRQLKKKSAAENCTPLLLWRRAWDSNPRGITPYLISGQARYDHFDSSPFFRQTAGLQSFFYKSLQPTICLIILAAHKEKVKRFDLTAKDKTDVPKSPAFICPARLKSTTAIFYVVALSAALPS